MDETARRIDETLPKIEDALTEIRRRSPRAAVYVLGYGDAIPETGDGCWPRVPLLPPDVAYIRATMHHLNAMIEQVAAAAGDHYVDLFAMTRGHDLCQPWGQAWMNVVSLYPAGFPGHPNAFYHHGVAPLIAAQIRADANPG